MATRVGSTIATRPSLLLALLACGAAPVAAQAVPDPVPDRPEARVASTRHFVFFSDARLNAHDFLLWRARSEAPVQTRAACVEAQPPGPAAAFRAAEAGYRARFAAEERASDRVLLDLRFDLAGWPEVAIVPDSAVAPVLALLEGALPVYEACWWHDHDERNRRWIAALLPRLVLHEDTLGARLARLYRADWQRPIPVDVAAYVNFGGANTIVDPHHVLVSAERPTLRADGALEIVFHEASHTLVGPRSGAFAEALARQARALGMERPPRDAWHILFFHAVGWETGRRLAETGVPGYQPYLVRAGLYERAWPEWREPLARHWVPYLEGAVGLDEAVRRVLEGVRAERGGAG